jgi:exodeoxyribonuclease V alpha subunit
VSAARASDPIDRRWPPAWAGALAGPDTDEAALYLAIEAASWPRELPAASRRAFALLVLASCEARTQGDTRLPLGAELGGRLDRLGARDEERALALALAAALGEHPALAPLVGRPGDHRPFIVDGGWLYQERDLRLELRLADALAARLAHPPGAAPAKTFEAIRGVRPWTTAQTAAIEAAATRLLTVVTGGPGSGKTALIGGIVRVWRGRGLAPEEIAVAAPTGKAANRIAEGLAAEGLAGPAPGTLHRLLGFSAHRSLRSGSFRHHEQNPLPHAGVIIDEASMVDLALVEQLARALRPEARLVLIGDADQLPAIQAGSVFRDLGAVALRLPESHRMSPDDPAGAAILAAARAIAAGAPPAGNPVVGTAGIDALAFAGFELCEPDARDAGGRRLVGAFCDRWFSRHLLPAIAGLDPRAALRLDGGKLEPDGEACARGILDRHRRARLLTVTRVGAAGSDRINAALARRAADELQVDADGDAPAPGTPVMMIESDYDRGLMNGDQGVALNVAAGAGGASTVVAFARNGALALFPAATLRGAIAVSYATTVHKAQGSELESAALILPEADLPLLSRELVYTAVTRARRSIVVVGRRALLAEAAARPLGRSSGLAERLAARGAFAPQATPAIDER